MPPKRVSGRNLTPHKNEGKQFLSVLRQFTETNDDDEKIPLDSSADERLFKFLHNLPPVSTYPTVVINSWDEIIYDKPVAVSFSDDSSSNNTETEVECFSCNSIKDNWFLNIGAPIWALDVSSPYISSLLDERPKKKRIVTSPKITNSEEFVVLAIGLAPWSQPLSLSQSDPLIGQSIIQLWKISSNREIPPKLTYGIKLNGQYCRSLAWVPRSNYKDKIGLLFVICGDGSLSCFSVPSDPFLSESSRSSQFRLQEAAADLFHSLSPIWYLTPSMFDGVQFTCLSPSPFIIVPDNVYSMENGDDKSSILQLAVGSKDGRIFIWRITDNTQSFDVPTIYPIYDKSPVTSICWVPIPNLPMLAAGSFEGKVRIWDIRLPLDGLIADLDNIKRPVYSIHWPHIARFLFISHESPYIYNSLKQEGNMLGGQGVERPSWACSSFAHIALFALDDGRLLMHPLNKLDRRTAGHTMTLSWKTKSYDKIEDSIDLERDIKAPVVPLEAAQEEFHGVLGTFYSEATKFYVKGFLKRSNGLSIQIGSEPPIRKVKKKVALEEQLKNYQNQFRLHSITSLDPIMYPNFLAPFIAYGGDSGIIHLFFPQDYFS